MEEEIMDDSLYFGSERFRVVSRIYGDSFGVVTVIVLDTKTGDLKKSVFKNEATEFNYSHDKEPCQCEMEIMANTASIKRAIEENKTRDIYKIIEKGDYYGMKTFDQSIHNLCVEKKIAVDVALDNATNRDDLQLKLRSIGIIES